MRCVSDNKKEGATPKVVDAWCGCMNEEMGTVFPTRTTRAAWKKSHPAEVAACDKESGWPTLRRRRRSR
jgi:hypothetical protein